MKTSETASSNPPVTTEDPPLPLPPSDPPDTAVTESKPAIDKQSRRALDYNNTMVISNNDVEMIATPELLYKMIRVVNHFVEHIITHYANVPKMEESISHHQVITKNND